VYREREGHAVAVRIEPRWPAYHLSILYLKGSRIRSFTGSLVIVIRPPGNTVKLVPVLVPVRLGRITATSNCCGDC
jgi:hypothetical protein